MVSLHQWWQPIESVHRDTNELETAVLGSEHGVSPPRLGLLGRGVEQCTRNRRVVDAFEVAEVFEVPLSFILDLRNHRTENHWVRGAHRRFHVFEYRNRYIWGATAGMLMNFYRRLHKSEFRNG